MLSVHLLGVILRSHHLLLAREHPLWHEAVSSSLSITAAAKVIVTVVAEVLFGLVVVVLIFRLCPLFAEEEIGELDVLAGILLLGQFYDELRDFGPFLLYRALGKPLLSKIQLLETYILHKSLP